MKPQLLSITIIVTIINKQRVTSDCYPTDFSMLDKDYKNKQQQKYLLCPNPWMSRHSQQMPKVTYCMRNVTDILHVLFTMQ